MNTTSKISSSRLDIKETRDYLKACLMDHLGASFDKKVWTLAWSKYKRMCDLYNNVAEYSREQEDWGDGSCLQNLVSFYEESAKKEQSTYNRDRRRELDGQLGGRARK